MSLLGRAVYASLLWKERRAGARRRDVGGRRETGRRGERLAYWFLRRAGYVVVGRNLRLRPGSGELDLVAWDGPVLAFVEVKTRTGEESGPPETALGPRQQERIVRAAHDYLTRLKRKAVNYRFDIVSVGWNPEEGFRLKLIKNAFSGAPTGGSS